MAHFYGGVKGCRKEATRTGTKNSGVRAYAQGWNIGAEVWVFHNFETGKDSVEVVLTKGANGGSTKFIGKWDE